MEDFADKAVSHTICNQPRELKILDQNNHDKTKVNPTAVGRSLIGGGANIYVLSYVRLSSFDSDCFYAFLNMNV